MKNISNRIKLIADNEGIKITQLESKIGASKGVLSRSITNNTDIQSKWVTLIVENYPQYNSEWLLTGVGPMLKSNSAQSTNAVTTIEEKCQLCEEKDKRIYLLENSIEHYQKEIEFLRNLVDCPPEAIKTKTPLRIIRGVAY